MHPILEGFTGGGYGKLFHLAIVFGRNVVGCRALMIHDQKVRGVTWDGGV